MTDTKQHRLALYSITRAVWLDGYQLNSKKSQLVINHSPDGFAWGYGGSGPAQLALAILIEIIGEEQAKQHYQEFKNNLIATLKIDESHEIIFCLSDYLKKYENK